MRMINESKTCRTYQSTVAETYALMKPWALHNQCFHNFGCDQVLWPHIDFEC